MQPIDEDARCTRCENLTEMLKKESEWKKDLRHLNNYYKEQVEELQAELTALRAESDEWFRDKDVLNNQIEELTTVNTDLAAELQMSRQNVAVFQYEISELERAEQKWAQIEAEMRKKIADLTHERDALVDGNQKKAPEN